MLTDADQGRYQALADRYRDAGDTQAQMTVDELDRLRRYANDNRNFMLARIVASTIDLRKAAEAA